MLRVSSAGMFMSYVCVYDFRVFRPRVSPFHRVHACFAAMCCKDRRVIAGSRNGEEGKGRGKKQRERRRMMVSVARRRREGGGSAERVWAREGGLQAIGRSTQSSSVCQPVIYGGYGWQLTPLATLFRLIASRQRARARAHIVVPCLASRFADVLSR